MLTVIWSSQAIANIIWVIRTLGWFPAKPLKPSADNQASAAGCAVAATAIRYVVLTGDCRESDTQVTRHRCHLAQEVRI
jgi:hypothetical protein